MSTRIEHGFRFPKRTTTVAHLSAWVKRTSNMLEDTAQALHQKALVAEAVRLHDRFLLAAAGMRLKPADLWPSDPAPADSLESWGELAAALRFKRLYDPSTPSEEQDKPPSCTVVLSQDHDGRLYGLVHASHDELNEAFMARAGVASYAYWNHTDPPDGMGLKRWAEREATWKRMLDKTGRRLNVLMQSELIPQEQEVPEFDPSPDQTNALDLDVRVEHWTQLLLGWRMDEERAATSSGAALDIGRILREHRELMEDREHPWRRAIEPQVRAALDASLTFDMLSNADLPGLAMDRRSAQAAAAQARVLALNVEGCGAPRPNRPRI